ncbi:MAG: Cysteine-tRNA ligase [Candidatus Curtissbacteria bacterium GW2011_GWC2_38_9]|uniref:Cysteine--tRNA ligase n=2 Tax=Candidatus Curtissiibacteriota TaxID=1752717 RepID=A0A1F5HR93_9BACT|nr:MAG: Cysteine-tRNA ligase [Candidatus Curtissbacteria bacterium GW2011_GWC2_38_9]OGE06731.1 MAG: cysteine--tRNA ligase [Candidatus Curtissbacteria bacterium RIFCSPLOWO2_02_41_11]
MKLYNSYSEKKETLDLSHPIGLYVCGITPYDTTHLGHAFTFLVYDVLVRYLRFLGNKVTYVQNVTDIDDDILIKAKSLGTTWQALIQAETKKHFKNMAGLNALAPDIIPYATGHIKEMISIIKVLIARGLAYEKNGSVYFKIRSDKNFGKLSKLGYRAMLQIANDRGNFPLDPNKRDPLDFVLWQKHKDGEPSWDSPWGRGRPGWHVECSAMAMKYLGPTITIHGGGEDLIFPHHEAEIAQSENYTKQKFVKIWMHTGMVYCDQKKMSKSLGNMVFVCDLLKIYSANTLRLYLLSHHWRQSWNYNEKKLEESQKTAKILEKSATKSSMDDREVQKNLPVFFTALDDDLNIPQAIEVLVSFAKSKNLPAGRQGQAGELITKCGQILGLKF